MIKYNYFCFSIHTLFHYYGAKGNITSQRAPEVEEKFDILIDANDQLLERVVCKFSLEDMFVLI